METHPPAPTSEALLRHDAWLRRLALGLLRDPARADDAVQDAWLAALKSLPRHGASPRAWLARILRSQVADRGRADARRADREARAARPEEAPSTADLTRRVELQRDVAAQVLGLGEPYRTAVLLRFFDDLPPREIAARTGRPVSTVHTHLERGLAELRGGLDQRYGERELWAPALVGLATRGGHLAGAASASLVVRLGAFLMTTQAKLALSAAAVLAAAVWTFDRGDSASPTRAGSGVLPGPRLVAPAQPETRVDPQGGRASVGTDRVAVASAGAPAEPASAAVDRVRLAGRLLDLDGRPLAGLALVYRERTLPVWGGSDGRSLIATGERLHVPPELARRAAADDELRRELLAGFPQPELAAEVLLGTYTPPRAVAGHDGSFELFVRSERGKVELEAGAWVLITHGTSRARPGETLFLAAPTVDFGGVVVDDDGTPLKDINVQIVANTHALPAFPYPLQSNYVRVFRALSGANGRFRLERAPRLPGLSLTTTRRGYRKGHAAIPDEPRDDLVLVMERERQVEPPAALGLVVDGNGGPVAGATVVVRDRRTETDEDGRFALPVPGWIRDEHRLVAFHPEHGAGSVPRIGERLRSEGTVQGLLVRLDGPLLAISGRIVDAQGEPLAGLDVNVFDGTIEEGTVEPREHQLGAQAKTGEGGRFRIGGLGERSYRLRFFNRRTGLLFVSEPLPAGAEEVEVVVPPDHCFERVAGRVVDRTGRPIEGVHVHVGFVIERRVGGRTLAYAEGTWTDAAGAFELAGVPRSSVFLRASGADLQSAEFPVEELDPHAARLAMARLARFCVELAEEDPADGFEVHDADGRVVTVNGFHVDSTRNYDRVPRRRGAFPPCEVTDDAAELVLFRGEEELRRVPLVLGGVELEVVRP